MGQVTLTGITHSPLKSTICDSINQSPIGYLLCSNITALLVLYVVVWTHTGMFAKPISAAWQFCPILKLWIHSACFITANPTSPGMATHPPFT